MTGFVFLDTEFSGLHQSEPRLISLALVPEDESDALYMELPAQDWMDHASAWTRENVVPHLHGGEAVVPVEALRDRIARWLDRQGTVRVVTDYPEYDFAFLQAILRPWHPGLHPQPVKFGAGSLGESKRPLLEQARSACFSTGQPQHNAWVDALALRCMWRAAQGLSSEFNIEFMPDVDESEDPSRS